MALACAAGIVLITFAHAPMADERYYAAQVRLFVLGRLELEPGITMLPGYHALLAALLAPFGEYSNLRARLANLTVGLALVPLAWALARRRWPREAPVKAAQTLLQPLAFPYLFLVYTEAWSLAVLVAMLLATFARRHALAAFLGLLGTVMRQDFIFWVAFAYALAALEGIDLARWRSEASALARQALAVGLPYLAVLAAFVAFVIWNGGVAMADREVHTRPYNLANLWFFYLCAWLAFLPHCLEAVPRIARLLRRPAVVAAVLAAFAIYWLAWSNPHPYNQAHLRFFLHNEALHWIDTNGWVRAVAFVPMAWGALALASTPLAEPRLRLLHVFAPLFALLHPLVEQRYYLPALLLYVVWRAPLEERWETATLLAYAAAGLLLLCGMTMGAFFP